MPKTISTYHSHITPPRPCVHAEMRVRRLEDVLIFAKDALTQCETICLHVCDFFITILFVKDVCTHVKRINPHRSINPKLPIRVKTRVRRLKGFLIFVQDALIQCETICLYVSDCLMSFILVKRRFYILKTSLADISLP